MHGGVELKRYQGRKNVDLMIYRSLTYEKSISVRTLIYNLIYKNKKRVLLLQEVEKDNAGNVRPYT